jgi:hypothetical protein
LTLFTDHLDDLPLMRESDTVCWFGPDATLATAQTLAAGTRFIRGRDLDSSALVAVTDQPMEASRAMTAA